MRSSTNTRLFLVFITSLLTTACGEKQDQRLNGTWIDEMDPTQQVVFSGENVTYYGESGTFTVSKRSNLDFAGGDDGTITLNLPSGRVTTAYTIGYNDTLLTLQYKIDESESRHLTRQGAHSVDLPLGWTQAATGLRYKKVTDMHFLPDNYALAIIEQKTFKDEGWGITASGSYKKPYHGLEGNWEPLPVPDIKWAPQDPCDDSKDQILAIATADGNVAITTVRGRTIVATNGTSEDDWTQVSSEFPDGGSYERHDECGSGSVVYRVNVASLAIVGDDLFAVIRDELDTELDDGSINTETTYKVYRMSDYATSDVPSWGNSYLWSRTEESWANPQMVSHGAGLLMNIGNIYHSTDGVTWTEAEAGLDDNVAQNLQLIAYDTGAIGHNWQSLYQLNDDGTQWTPLTNWSGISRTSANNGMLVGHLNGQPVMSLDGGQTRVNVGTAFTHPRRTNPRVFVGNDYVWAADSFLVRHAIPQ